MVVSVILCAFVIILWVSFLWSRRKYYALARKMPGPPGLPLLGRIHLLLNTEEILYYMPNLASQIKRKTFFTWFGPYPTIYTMEPEFAQIILNSPNCINKSFMYDGLVDVFGDGLIVSKSPIWNRHRKLLNPAFNHKTLLDFIPNFNKQAHEFCDLLDKHVNCGEVDLKKLLFNLTLKSTVASTMGLDFNQDSDMSFIRHSERALEIAAYLILKPWFRIPGLFSLTSKCKLFKESNAFITDFVHRLVKNKLKVLLKHELNGNNNKSNAMEESIDIEKTKHIFIDQAIKIHQKKEFTLDDVVAETRTVVFAGFDTTANTLFSTLMCLAMHPQYQEKVFEEISTVFPNKEFDVKYEDLDNLVYLDMCINETLRVVTTVPVVGRICSKDVPLSTGAIIPKGTHIVLDVLSIHKDEDTWGPDAKAFNPDHVLPENLANQHKYSFMPYLKGPRTCIGWQYAGIIMKVVLAQVLRKYRFSSKTSFGDLKFVDHITLQYKQLPLLEIQRR